MHLIRNLLRSKFIMPVVLILIVVLAAFLRIYRIGTLSFWLDEAFTFFAAKGTLIQAIKLDPNMSLFNVIAHLWIRFFPNASDGLLRGLSATFSIASVLVVFFLGREMLIKEKGNMIIGLLSAFLVAINSFHIQYAQEFRSYSLTLLLTTVSTYFLEISVTGGNKKQIWLIAYTLTSAAAIYSHFYAVFVIAAQIMSLPFLFLSNPRGQVNTRQFLFSFGGLAILVAPIAIIAYQKGSGGINWIPLPSFDLVLDFFSKISGRSDDGRWLILLYFLLGGLGFLYGFGFTKKQDKFTKWKYLLALSCFIVPPILSLLISFLITPIFLDRYLLFILPFEVVLASTGIKVCMSYFSHNRFLRNCMITIGVVSTLLLALLSSQGIRSYYRDFTKNDWRTAAQFIFDNCSDGLRLYYPPFIERAVVYYKPELLSREMDWSNSIYNLKPDPISLIQSYSKNHERICLILAHVDNPVQESDIKAVFQREYVDQSSSKFDEITIEIYNK